MMKALLVFSIYLFNIKSIFCRKCAYFPQYPDLSVVKYKSCKYDQSCYEGFTSNVDSVCADYGFMWWLLFIVIPGVILLILSIVFLYCLVKKNKQLKHESLLLPSNKTNEIDSNVNPYATKSAYEINYNDTDLNSPNYVPLFSRTGTTIDLKDPNTIMPVLPASHLADDDDGFNIKQNEFTSFSRQATIIQLNDGVVLPASHLTEDKSVENDYFSSRPGTATIIEVKGNNENEFAAPVLPASHFDNNSSNLPIPYKRAGALSTIKN